MCPACGLRYETPALAPLPAPSTARPVPQPAPVAQAAPTVVPSHRSHRWIISAAVGSLLLVVIGAIVLIRNLGPRPDTFLPSPTARSPASKPTTAVAPTVHVARPEITTTHPIPVIAAPATVPTNRVEQATTAPADEISTALAPSSEQRSVPPTTTPAVAAPIVAEPVAQGPRFHVRPVRPQIDGAADSLDEQIGQTIQRGTSYMLHQFKAGKLQDTEDISKDTLPGLHALAVYALLQAGAATVDERLGPHSPAVEEVLKVLKALPMDRGPATYSRALRAAALGVYDRAEDRQVLRADAQWLLKAASDGAYTYQLPERAGSRRAGVWDNSNSQYGALGVWAASEAGVPIPASYWKEVELHWLECQLPTGEWSYTDGSRPGRLSMTVAGITTLFVAQEQLGATGATGAAGATTGRAPFMPALTKALKWLETDNNAVDLPWRWRTYNLYGLERAALASGFKYFGKHDWYRELAKDALLGQRPDGSWYTRDGELNPVVDTAFTLLFLSRGRHPIFMNKLRFEGAWANRPRDLSSLNRFAVHSLERQLNWQVVSLAGDWLDWTESPILFIASHEVPTLAADDYDKLRAFAENGGLIFTHSDDDSPAFSRFVESLCQRVFPSYPLADLPPSHPIYSTLFKVEPKPRLQGVSNGSRLLLIHSPTDLNRDWQTRDAKAHAGAFQIGLNTFIYAAGKVNFRNKLKTSYVPEPNVTPIATATIARLRYDGNWDPEPAAWTRFSRLFLAETSIKLEPTPIDIQDLQPDFARFAHLTGTEALRLDARQIKSIHDFVAAGGVLLIDACGGSSAFAQSLRAELLPRIFPKSPLKPIPPEHALLAGAGEGMSRIAPRLRPYTAETLGTLAVRLEMMQEGEGAVIFTGFDLTTALLGTGTYTVTGCDPETATPLCRNILLWTLAGKP